MKMRSFLYTLVVAISISVASANTFKSEDFEIEVPDGFDGPLSASKGPEISVIAFVKPHAEGTSKTLLQASVYRPTKGLPAIPRERLGEVADRCVGDFLGGIERRRQQFTSTTPERVEVGGIPSSRVTWRGMADGKWLHGAMYCTLVGVHFISFHAQALESAPTLNFQQAEAAIYGVRFVKAD